MNLESKVRIKERGLSSLDIGDILARAEPCRRFCVELDGIAKFWAAVGLAGFRLSILFQAG